MDWLRLVGLDGFEDHYPSQLSGGMQKRVSIIRTLIYEPEVILLDEPFRCSRCADSDVSCIMNYCCLWQKQKSTMLFITHDLVEAITLSDQIVIMTRQAGAREGDLSGAAGKTPQRFRDLSRAGI